MREPTLPEGIIRLTHALVEDAALRSWFMSLEELPPARRCTAFDKMAAKMHARREEAELVAAVSTLARPEVYAAVRDAVRELCRS